MRSITKRGVAALAAVALVGAISACGGSEDSGGSAQESGAAAQQTVKMGFVKSTANLAAALAPQYAEKEGLKVQTENFNNAVDIATALVNGQLDVGLLTPIHLIRSVDAKTNLVQISGNTRGNTAVVVSKKLNVAEGDWAALKAANERKKLRVASSAGSINEALAILEFAKNGIDLDKDMELVNVANFAQHAEGLRSGQFDVIVSLEPVATLAINQGGQLFSRPYESPAGDLNTNYVVRKDWLGENRDTAQKFVNTIAAAEKALDADKQLGIDTGTKLTGLPPAIVEAALGNNRYNVENGIDEMQALAKLAAERGWTKQDVSGQLPQFVDESLVSAATKQ